MKLASVVDGIIKLFNTLNEAAAPRKAVIVGCSTTVIFGDPRCTFFRKAQNFLTHLSECCATHAYILPLPRRRRVQKPWNITAFLSSLMLVFFFLLSKRDESSAITESNYTFLTGHGGSVPLLSDIFKKD